MVLLWASLAQAGLLNALSEEDRQVRVCQEAAADAEAVHDYARATGVWDACLRECARLGFEGALPMLRDQHALSAAMAEAAAWRTADPDRWAQAVLAVAAGQGSVEYPTDAVADVFRGWMGTEAGKARLEPVRTVTVQWEGDADVRVSQLFRRYLEDLGLRWADPGDPEVDVIVFARVAVRDLEPRTSSRMGSLARAEATVEVDRVRFRHLDLTEAGFEAVASTEHADAPVAREEALRSATERAAARVLKTVLKVVFR